MAPQTQVNQGCGGMNESAKDLFEITPNKKLTTKTATATVETLIWNLPFDIFGKAFENYLFEIGLGPGKSPDSVGHPGIIVFGYMYEYGDFGVVRFPIQEVSQELETAYGIFTPTQTQVLGTTEKTLEQFEKWIRIQSNSGNFTYHAYDMVNNNCLHFSMEVCKFLEVEYPNNWKKICSWLGVNKPITEKFAKCAVVSRNIYYKLKKASSSPWLIIDFIQKQIIMFTLQDSSE